MDETKKWYESRTIWGAVAAVAAGALGLLGYSLGEADTATLTELLAALGGVIGGAVALAGRVKAKAKIESKKA